MVNIDNIQKLREAYDNILREVYEDILGRLKDVYSDVTQYEDGLKGAKIRLVPSIVETIRTKLEDMKNKYTEEKQKLPQEIPTWYIDDKNRMREQPLMEPHRLYTCEISIKPEWHTISIGTQDTTIRYISRRKFSTLSKSPFNSDNTKEGLLNLLAAYFIEEKFIGWRGDYIGHQKDILTTKPPKIFTELISEEEAKGFKKLSPYLAESLDKCVESLHMAIT